MRLASLFGSSNEEVFMVSDMGTISGMTGERGFVEVHERHEEGRLTGAAHSHVAWGAVIAGGLTALALLVLSSSFAFAAGIPAYRGGGFNALTGFWAVLSSMAAFFVGGCLGTYLTPRGEMRTGVVHGMLAWVLGVMLMVVLSGAVLGIYRGAVAPDLRYISVTGELTHGQVVGAAWTGFIALFLGRVCSGIGGIVGALRGVRGRE
jgi:hypothetical protein